MVSVSAVVVLYVLSVFYRGAEGLSCWVCSSDVRGQEQCADPFSTYNSRSVGLRTCDHILPPPSGNFYQQYCKKMTTRRNYGLIVQRTCAWGPITDARHYICNTFGQEEFCDVCNYDGCNGSNVHVPSFFMAIIIPTILWYLLRS